MRPQRKSRRGRGCYSGGGGGDGGGGGEGGVPVEGTTKRL